MHKLGFAMNDEARKKLEADTTLYYAKRLAYAVEDVTDGHIVTMAGLKSFVKRILDMIENEMKLQNV